MRGGRRRGRWWIAIAAVLVLVVGGLVWRARAAPSYRTEPTIPGSAKCGAGGPAALLAVDATSGRLRWSARTGDAGEIAVTPGVVAVQDGRRVVALDPRTGRARWCHDEPGTDPTIGTVAAGEVLVTASPRQVVGRRASDGREVWRHGLDLDELASDGRRVLVRSGFASDQGQRTRAYDGRTGRLAWSFRTPSPGIGLALPADQVASRTDDLTFFDDGLGVTAAGPPGAGTDVVRWTRPVFRPGGTAGDLVLGGIPPSLTEPLTRFELTGLDQATGATRWHRTVPGFDGRVAGDLVVVLAAADPADAPVPGDTAPPRPHDPRAGSVVTAYRATDGRTVWQRDVGYASRIFVAADRVVLWRSGDEGHDGRVTALSTATGATAWTRRIVNPSRVAGDVGDDLLDVAADASGTEVLLLVTAEKPYRD